MEALGLAICFGGALFLLHRLRNVRRGVEAKASRPPGEVSVIVPARNEAHNLPTLLASLRALGRPPCEIIVVDDGSSDGTAAVARSYGARVIVAEPRPSGWIGKPWACLAGARAARGDFLLFTDADTWHASRSLEQALSALDGVGLVSVVPTHRAERPWETLQGIFQLLLLVATRADARRRASRGRPFAIGQYLLFRRDAYWSVGGHAATPARIAEDLALAELISRSGYGVRVLFAPGALRVRMYPEGFAAFFAGWRRNFREGLPAAGLFAVLELALVIGWLLGIPVWFVQAAWTGSLIWSATWVIAYLASTLLVARAQRLVGAFPAWSGLAYPLFALVFVAVTCASLLDAAFGRPVTWRGRTFELSR